MKFRIALALSAAFALAACKPGAAPAEAPAPAAPASAAATSAAPAAAPASAAPAPAASVAAPAAAAAQPAPQPYTGPALVPGVDYTEIAGGQPFEPLDGKVEVVEFFNYICPACAAFENQFESWRARQPADVRVTLVPATFRPDFAAYAKAYYAADALGVAAKSHKALFDAIHLQHALPGEGEAFDEDKVAAFYAQYGVGADQFKNALHSFAVNGKTNKATQYLMASQVASTPSLLVDGKYLVKGRSWDDMIRILDGLVAQERAKAAR
jgi:thiol:disulfide interchange protein DsbA